MSAMKVGRNQQDMTILTMMMIIIHKNSDILLQTPRSQNLSHSEDEKYEEDGVGDYVTTQTGPSMMTMGDNMLNVLRFIPWNENEYLPQELDESYDERIVPRFGIKQSLNEIIRFHWNGDA